ncbi:MAG: serine/threonine-protein phosphatase [Ruminococcus sp.]|uniref:PP2C family protein-serine/threonine phosphatase n=1 Tax=Ruminococcus sp. TaxID=41978 RepID=UPI001B1B495D|nr:PP2C family serine/threonine-protein phosphatase [Ruminococcus sp.]MBO7473277.1 serine/threonine-protein phosphatase [Ruminococcus sp.]
MKYIAACDTDAGISKYINQDSVCVKTAETGSGKAALILVCDGMGGLSRGELASAEVIRSFAEWFDSEFPFELPDWNWETAARNVISRLRRLNAIMVDYGMHEDIQLGTTATGIIAVDSKFMTFHVGDTRIYKISDKLSQLTDDHTFVNREVKNGRMTPEEAKTDPRRNALVQCVGVTADIFPEVKLGDLESGANYMICSDGFRHVLTEKELFEELSPERTVTKADMQKKLRELIDTVKAREENDNITAALFRPEF